MTKITCPHCNRTGASSKNVPQGAKVRCPGCGKTFLFEAPDPAIVEVLPTPTIPLSQVPPAVPTPPTSPVLTPVTPHSVLTPAAVPFQQVIQVAGPERQKTNPIGVAALVLGILAALIAWVPFLGLLAIPAGLLGALLGAIGLIYGLVTKRGKVTAAGIGLGLSLGSVILSVAMTGMAANRVSNALAEAERNANKSARPVVETTKAVPQPAVKIAKVVSGGEPAKPVVQPEPPAPASVESWLSPDQPGQLGNVQVRVVSVTLGKMTLRESVPFPGQENDRRQSKEALLSVLIEVSNLDPNRKLDFKTLAGSHFSFTRDNALLQDNFSNRYRGIDFGFSALPEFRTKEESIYPGRTIRDQLVFEAPIANATHLDLEIPGKNVGQEGTFRFRIPAKAIRKQESE